MGPGHIAYVISPDGMMSMSVHEYGTETHKTILLYLHNYHHCKLLSIFKWDIQTILPIITILLIPKPSSLNDLLLQGGDVSDQFLEADVEGRGTRAIQQQAWDVNKVKIDCTPNAIMYQTMNDNECNDNECN